MMKTIECTVTDTELHDLVATHSHMPCAVALRLLLNQKGIKFVDDGKLSSAVNMEPMPLGVLHSWEDVSTGTTHYKQVLENEDECSS